MIWTYNVIKITLKASWSPASCGLNYGCWIWYKTVSLNNSRRLSPQIIADSINVKELAKRNIKLGYTPEVLTDAGKPLSTKFLWHCEAKPGLQLPMCQWCLLLWLVEIFVKRWLLCMRRRYACVSCFLEISHRRVLVAAIHLESLFILWSSIEYIYFFQEMYCRICWVRPYRSGNSRSSHPIRLQRCSLRLNCNNNMNGNHNYQNHIHFVFQHMGHVPGLHPPSTSFSRVMVFLLRIISSRKKL
jgi:hypothetical protein